MKRQARHKRLADLCKTCRSAQTWALLAARLASIVDQVEFTDRSDCPPDSRRRRIPLFCFIIHGSG